MSAETEVTEIPAFEKAAEANAQSAEDVRKLLAELREEAKVEPAVETKVASTTTPAVEETNGATNGCKDKNETDKAPERSQEIVESKGIQGEPEEARRRDHRHESRPLRGGRGGFRNSRSYKDNIKSDLTTQEESSDPVAIRKQVEFYFSESNLPMDRFLLSKVGGSANNPVEIKILHSFKRMRHFQPFEAIVSALKDSTVLNVTDNDTCVKRKEPLPEIPNDGSDPQVVRVFEDRAMPRSVYVKGFGEEVPSTQFDIEAFFAPYGPTNAIRLRRSDSRLFKGSVFAEFATEDLQRAFLALDPKPKFKGQDLQTMSKKEYCDGKVEAIKEGKIKPHANKFAKSWKDNKRKRDDEDDRDWRERREEDRRSGFKAGGRRGGHKYGSKAEKNDNGERGSRGVPKVEDLEEEGRATKAKRNAATADALAKARTMVEAEKCKTEESKAEAVGDKPEPNSGSDERETLDGLAASTPQGTENGESKKRAREDNDSEDGPKVKKVDNKTDAPQRDTDQSCL